MLYQVVYNSKFYFQCVHHRLVPGKYFERHCHRSKLKSWYWQKKNTYRTPDTGQGFRCLNEFCTRNTLLQTKDKIHGTGAKSGYHYHHGTAASSQLQGNTSQKWCGSNATGSRSRRGIKVLAPQGAIFLVSICTFCCPVSFWGLDRFGAELLGAICHAEFHASSAGCVGPRKRQNEMLWGRVLQQVLFWCPGMFAQKYVHFYRKI